MKYTSDTRFTMLHLLAVLIKAMMACSASIFLCSILILDAEKDGIEKLTPCILQL